LGFEIGRKKEPRSHFYICSAEHFGNYRNSLMYTLDHPPYIDVEVALLIEAIPKSVLFIDAISIETIIPLSKKLSIVFVRRPRNIMELRSNDTS
jgi:hypothetical protein